MSIANGTTYYDYPLVQLSDRPTFADYNAAFSDIDAKLHGLITGAETDHQAITDLQTSLGQTDTLLASVKLTADSAKAKSDTNEENIIILNTRLGQTDRTVATKLDSVAIAEPYDPDAGTYNVGDVVVYNGQRYVCTTAVAVSEPFDADKWTGQDVETVLDDIKSTLSGLEPVTLATVTADGTNSYSNLLNALYSQLDISFGDFRKLTLSIATGGSLLIFEPSDYDGSKLRFSKSITNASAGEIATCELMTTGSHFYAYSTGTGTVSDLSSNQPANGSILSIVKVP